MVLVGLGHERWLCSYVLLSGIFEILCGKHYFYYRENNLKLKLRWNKNIQFEKHNLQFIA